MPRYFFHIKDEATTMLDQEGIELDDLDAVREEASQAARQWMGERGDGHEPDGRAFVVADEQGDVVLNFPFKDAMSD